ncbi:MAG: hypothetical protein ACRDMI_01615 [Streptosporangiaceae bacterium]
MMSEDVACEAGWFWWPWADRIAPVTDVGTAADTIVRVLCSADGQHG